MDKLMTDAEIDRLGTYIPKDDAFVHLCAQAKLANRPKLDVGKVHKALSMLLKYEIAAKHPDTYACAEGIEALAILDAFGKGE